MTALWDMSFRENVSCARDIETAIRETAGRDDASPIIKKYGFKRTMYVLAHSLNILGQKGVPTDESKAWAAQIRVTDFGDFGRYFMVDTAIPDLEEFIREVQAAYKELGLFDREQRDPAFWNTELTGKVLVLSTDSLKESAWSQENQLWIATGGFGCRPDARGRAIFATCLWDGERTRWNRSDFIGVLDDRFLPEWARSKLEKLTAEMQPERTEIGGIGS